MFSLSGRKPILFGTSLLELYLSESKAGIMSIWRDDPMLSFSFFKRVSEGREHGSDFVPVNNSHLNSHTKHI